MKNDKQNKITIKNIANRCNISEQTFYNWKKEKPELVKLIEMGLEFEKILEKYKN